MESILSIGGIWKVNLAQNVCRPVISMILSIFIIGSSMLEGFLYFVIADDVNQGVVPWDEFWSLSKLTVIRFLFMALVIYIICRLGSIKLFILLVSIALIEFAVFLGGRHFIFFPPLLSNLLLSVVYVVIMKKWDFTVPERN